MQTADIEWEIEDFYILLYRVYKKALRDAGRGDTEAVSFLDETLPDWQERISRREGKRWTSKREQ